MCSYLAIELQDSGKAFDSNRLLFMLIIISLSSFSLPTGCLMKRKLRIREKFDNSDNIRNSSDDK